MTIKIERTKSKDAAFVYDHYYDSDWQTNEVRLVSSFRVRKKKEQEYIRRDDVYEVYCVRPNPKQSITVFTVQVIATAESKAEAIREMDRYLMMEVL